MIGSLWIYNWSLRLPFGAFGSPLAPKGAPRGPKGCPQGAQGGPQWTQGVPLGRLWHPLGSLLGALGLLWGTRGCLGVYSTILSKMGGPIPSKWRVCPQPVDKSEPRGTHPRIRRIPRIRTKWHTGRSSQPHFIRAGGQDDVSSNQTPSNEGNAALTPRGAWQTM